MSKPSEPPKLCGCHTSLASLWQNSSWAEAHQFISLRVCIRMQRTTVATRQAKPVTKAQSTTEAKQEGTAGLCYCVRVLLPFWLPTALPPACVLVTANSAPPSPSGPGALAPGAEPFVVPSSR